MPIITLLTDFGTADSYVGEVKGVLLSQAPSATLVDITHQVPPGNVRAAAYFFDRSWKHFPPGTVHLVVVDPGVGTARGALALSLKDQFFVGPDNGVFTSVLAEPTMRGATLIIPPEASPTFHGRDVFAAAAATLANRGWWPEMGMRLTGPGVRLSLSAPERDKQGWLGEVVQVDRFGNLITNLGREPLLPECLVEIGDRSIVLAKTYADVEAGALLAYVGSSGAVEIALRGGSAAQLLRAEVGQRVHLRQR